MVEPDNAKSETYSLYKKHLDIIENNKKNKNFNSNAASLQNIIDAFNSSKKIEMYKNIMIFILYPMILCAFALYGARNMQSAISKLFEKGYSDIGELANLEVIYTSFGFMTLGILVMCMIFFFAIVRKNYGN